MTMGFFFLQTCLYKNNISDFLQVQDGPNWSHVTLRQWEASIQLLSFLSRRQGIAFRERCRHIAPPLNSSGLIAVDAELMQLTRGMEMSKHAAQVASLAAENWSHLMDT